ncbi:MAG: hypothetical protein QM523_01040 [Candidatus Pacebacteria bacterium]|nr:hypothetical protein [Candidatus Paceibacterota bacterium]
MVAVPYNITPTLGADFRDPETANYWDLIDPSRASNPSPQLGTMLQGNNGFDYVYGKATPAFAALARADLNTTTWAFTANASGAWEFPVAVAAGENAWAKRFVI